MTLSNLDAVQLFIEVGDLESVFVEVLREILLVVDWLVIQLDRVVVIIPDLHLGKLFCTFFGHMSQRVLYKLSISLLLEGRVCLTLKSKESIHNCAGIFHLVIVSLDQARLNQLPLEATKLESERHL
jgi:hypothetical protein